MEAAELLGAAVLTALGAEAVLRVWRLALDVEPEEPDDPFALEEDALCAVALVLVPVLSVDDAGPRWSALALAARAMTAPAPISEPATTPRLTRRSRAKAASRVAGVRSMVLIVYRLRKRIARIAAILPKDETG